MPLEKPRCRKIRDEHDLNEGQEKGGDKKNRQQRSTTESLPTGRGNAGKITFLTDGQRIKRKVRWGTIPRVKIRHYDRGAMR